MRAVNTIKPVNVLVRFIAEWIAAHRAEAAPFDSFESLRPERTEHKEVERWIFNCNYVYYRLGDALLAHDALPDTAHELEMLFAHLDANVKTIRDSTPLNLRSKSPEALRTELAKDWPPFQRHSRTTRDRTTRALDAFTREEAPGTAAPTVAQELWEVLQDEERLYARITRKAEASADPLAARMRALLPIWCLAAVNPLYTLRLWEDGASLDALARELYDAWHAHDCIGTNGTEGRASYRGLIRRCHEDYRTHLGAQTDGELGEQPLPLIHQTLEEAFFSLDHPSTSTAIPTWLAPKCLLIWNTVVCSILGPAHVIRPSGPNRTATTRAPAVAPVRTQALAGIVTLRRHRADGSIEPIASLTMAQETTSRTWLVLGSSFDENARVPAALAGMSRAEISACSVATSRFDAQGAQVEGRGDSRYHALIRVDAQDGRASIVLSDLGSKNGTYVMRRTDSGTRYLVLQHRTAQTAADWARRAGVDPAAVCICDSVELARGDVLQLCGSCFDLV